MDVKEILKMNYVATYRQLCEESLKKEEDRDKDKILDLLEKMKQMEDSEVSYGLASGTLKKAQQPITLAYTIKEYQKYYKQLLILTNNGRTNENLEKKLESLETQLKTLGVNDTAISGYQDAIKKEVKDEIAAKKEQEKKSKEKQSKEQPKKVQKEKKHKIKKVKSFEEERSKAKDNPKLGLKIMNGLIDALVAGATIATALYFGLMGLSTLPLVALGACSFVASKNTRNLLGVLWTNKYLRDLKAQEKRNAKRQSKGKKIKVKKIIGSANPNSFMYSLSAAGLQILSMILLTSYAPQLAIGLVAFIINKITKKTKKIGG